MKKLTISAVLASVIAIMVAPAFAAPQKGPRIPETSAERYQTEGNLNENGDVLRR